MNVTTLTAMPSITPLIQLYLPSQTMKNAIYATDAT